MADTSFRFPAESNSNVASSDEEGLDFEEEEYDALNDETFGTLEDSTGLDDWEEQHEQFAELTENSRQHNIIEKSLNKLVLNESNLYPAAKDSVWAYKETTRNGDAVDSPIKLESFVASSGDKSTSGSPFINADAKKIPESVVTLEEIERALLKNRPKVPTHNRNVQHPPLAQIPLPHAPGRFPSVFPPPPPPPMCMPPHLRHLHHGPPGLARLIPPSHYMHHGGHPRGPPYPLGPRPPHGPTPPPGFYPMNPPFPINHPMNFPLPLRLPPPRMHEMAPHPNMMGHYQNHQNHNDQYYYNNHYSHNNRGANEDEYAGLMSNREKQWLINIQLIQLNTGTPYFDDYYYTIFKERKLRNSKENVRPTDRSRRQSIRRNSERDGQSPLTPKVYTPLQFENSLGKLQCGSVTAPRKIIDMDIVAPDKDSENSNTTRDTKKTKQFLLELELLYNDMLKAEDLQNPLYKINMDKMYEIKQKQKLRELEVATTAEQKQEIVKSLREDSEPLDEDPHEFLVKVVNGLFQEDKYVSFLSIRKGKMLLLRILPYVTNVNFSSTQICDLWIKVFLSLPIIGRKDANGDNVFVRLYPFFKRFIHTNNMDVILEIITNLLEVPSPNINRGTPITSVGKQLLTYIVANKFGVSAIAALFVRVEQLLSSSNIIEDHQQSEWFNFVISCVDSLAVPKVVLETPIEHITTNIFNTHCGRISSLTEENRNLLEKWLTNCNQVYLA